MLERRPRSFHSSLRSGHVFLFVRPFRGLSRRLFPLLSSFEVTCARGSKNVSLFIVLKDDDDDPLLDVIINCRSPLLIPTFINEGTPDASFNPSLEITNYSKTHHSDIYVKISSISDGAIVERIDDYNLLSTFSPYGTSIEELNYQVQLEDIAYGSEITFLVEFQKNNINILLKNIRKG